MTAGPSVGIGPAESGRQMLRLRRTDSRRRRVSAKRVGRITPLSGKQVAKNLPVPAPPNEWFTDHLKMYFPSKYNPLGGAGFIVV